MKKATITLFAAMWLCAGAISAQQPSQAPQPGPEHKRLAYFAGNWNSEGETKQNPFMPAGKFTSVDKNELMPGGFFVVLNSTSQGPMGSTKEMAVMGYNAEERAYTYDGFNSMGGHDVSRGTIEGSTWTWLGDSKMEGKTIKGRFTIQEISSTSYRFKYEYSPDGSSWTNIMEGKSTKVK